MNRVTEVLVNCQQQAFKIYIKNNLLKYIMPFFFATYELIINYFTEVCIIPLRDIIIAQ